MDGEITIHRDLPVVRWRDARLHVRVHTIVRDDDQTVAAIDMSASVTVDASDDGGAVPRLRVAPRGPRR